MVLVDVSNTCLDAADAVSLAEGIKTSKHAKTIVEMNMSNNKIWHTSHSKTLGNPMGFVSLLQLIGKCPELKYMSLAGNRIESAIDSCRIRSVISNEIGVRPHTLTREIWKVPTTCLEYLDVRGCGMFRRIGSLKEVLEDIERCQEMNFFMKCLSTGYGVIMDGSNTKMPLRWENRSPADVALQILGRHGISASTWASRKAEVYAMLRKWVSGGEILNHGDPDS